MFLDLYGVEVRIRLTKNIEGMSYQSGKPEGTPFFFAKGTEGTVIGTSRSRGMNGKEEVLYFIKMDAYQGDALICSDTKAMDILDKDANRKSIKINMYKERM